MLRWLADGALSWGAAAAALVARMSARATSPNAISPSIAGSRRDWGEIDMLLAVLGPIGQRAAAWRRENERRRLERGTEGLRRPSPGAQWPPRPPDGRPARRGGHARPARRRSARAPRRHGRARPDATRSAPPRTPRGAPPGGGRRTIAARRPAVPGRTPATRRSAPAPPPRRAPPARRPARPRTDRRRRPPRQKPARVRRQRGELVARAAATAEGTDRSAAMPGSTRAPWLARASCSR